MSVLNKWMTTVQGTKPQEFACMHDQWLLYIYNTNENWNLSDILRNYDDIEDFRNREAARGCNIVTLIGVLLPRVTLK
jgi:hypothetical protein